MIFINISFSCSHGSFPALLTPFPRTFIIKCNPALITPFPDIAFISKEATGCIDEEAIGAINEAAIGAIIPPQNLP